MTENPQTGPTDAPTPATGPAGQPSQPSQPSEPSEFTGHPVVDEVLETMQGLQDRPVEEHVAIFEAAHEKLRAALTDAGHRGNPTGG